MARKNYDLRECNTIEEIESIPTFRFKLGSQVRKEKINDKTILVYSQLETKEGNINGHWIWSESILVLLTYFKWIFFDDTLEEELFQNSSEDVYYYHIYSFEEKIEMLKDEICKTQEENNLLDELKKVYDELFASYNLNDIEMKLNKAGKIISSLINVSKVTFKLFDNYEEAIQLVEEHGGKRNSYSLQKTFKDDSWSYEKIVIKE